MTREADVRNETSQAMLGCRPSRASNQQQFALKPWRDEVVVALCNSAQHSALMFRTLSKSASRAGQKECADEGEIMLSDMTNTRVIQVWFAAVALSVVAALAFGATVRVETGGMLLTLSLVPPLIVFLLWPRAQSLTAADVIRGADRHL
jgi:hypothetical protein